MRKFALSMGLLLTLAANAGADTYTYDFYGGTSGTSGPTGNIRAFSANEDDSRTVLATGWGFPSVFGTFEEGYLGHYSTGLGVTNFLSDGHTIDNSGRDEMVALYFDPLLTGVVTLDIILTRFGDADASINFAAAAAETHGAFLDLVDRAEGFADLPGTFVTQLDPADVFDESPEGYTFLPNDQLQYRLTFDPAQTGNALFVAASQLGYNDSFKLTAVILQTAPPNQEMPEPGSLAFVAVGAGAFLARRARS